VPHPNSPAGRTDLGRALNAMLQVRRDSYHLGGDYAANEMEAQEKIRETMVRLLTRIKSEVTTNVMAPLTITDPILFAQLSAEQWMDDFRESRRDHEHFRDWLLEGLKQRVDSVDELKDVKLEDVPRQVGLGLRFAEQLGPSSPISMLRRALSTWSTP
jgi:hypothetical protein